MVAEPPAEDYVPVADIEVDAVQPTRAGFLLTGRGRDRSDYRLEVQIEMPLDQRTRAVLGELLSQSDVRLWRRAPRTLRNAAQRPKKPVN